jgi:cellulose synthase/poly-beta-1,6-N-acetylglucosamine synthase-like glycosyltransferase
VRRSQRVSFSAQRVQTPAGELEQAWATKDNESARSQNGDQDLSAVAIADQSRPELNPDAAPGMEHGPYPPSVDFQQPPERSIADVPTRQESAISLADIPTRRVRAVSLAGLPVTPFPVNQAPETPLPTPAEPLDERLRAPVERYLQWLQRNNSLQDPLDKLQLYRELSMQMHKVGRREVRTFAPFQASTSALRVITPAQVLLLALLFLCWGAGLLFLRVTMITVGLGLVTVLYILGFITSSLLATSSFGKDSGEKIDEEMILALDKQGATWPMYTILCPLFKETAVVPQFVAAIKALHYPLDRLQVLFLTEEIDKETRAALYAMQLPPNFEILTFGLLQAKGQFTVIFDAEDQPEPYQLKKAILTFANHGPEVACVQAKLNYYNTRQNLLTRWFTAEYSTWFDIMLPGLQRSGLSLPLGGTSNHFRTEVLCALGGWDAFNVTEDCDLGLRISQYGLKTAVLDSTTYEEATSRYKTWLLQRSRWIKGYMQTYLVHMRHPLRMLLRGHVRKFFSLQLIVGVWTFVLLVNPVMWALTLCYVVLRPEQLYSVLFPGPVLYMGAFCLIFGNFFYIYIHFLGCLCPEQFPPRLRCTISSSMRVLVLRRSYQLRYVSQPCVLAGSFRAGSVSGACWEPAPP